MSNKYLINYLLGIFAFIGIIFCVFGLYCDRPEYITVGVTIVLVTITAHYAYSTQKALEINSKSLELMMIQQRKPRVEILANNFLEPISKDVNFALSRVKNQKLILHLHEERTSKRCCIESDWDYIPDKVFLGLYPEIDILSQYLYLKLENNIDASYPDKTFKKFFPEFDKNYNELLSIIEKLNKLISDFQITTSSYIKKNIHIENFNGFEPLSVLNNPILNYTLTKLFQEVFSFKCNLISYQKVFDGLPSSQNKSNKPLLSVIDQKYEEYISDNKPYFDK